MASKTDIFDKEFLSNLQRLSIAAKKPFRGALKGEKRSPKRGSSIEFADYREYVPGDDFRYIDWVLYGRLDRLYLKLFEEEEDLFTYVLLDESLSMAFGDPTKFETGQRLAAALAYIALSSLNRVQVSTFSHRLTHRFGPKRGKSSIYPLFDFLAAREPVGPSNVGRSLREFNATTSRRGVVVVLSDFLFQEGYKEALAPIVGRGFDVGCIQIMDNAEIDPGMEGDLLLLDSETGEEREVTMSPAAVKRYRDQVSAYNAELREWCFSHRANYTLVTTDMDFRDVVMRYLRLQGFLT
ncbi:MAG: DUF58 domain-containing protein [Armatimonadia bacterium]|nr:DUF58 domain-containing protein [Armatimonadia bacterium]